MLATQMVVEEGEYVLQEGEALNVLLFYYCFLIFPEGFMQMRLLVRATTTGRTVPPGPSDSCPVLTSSKSCLCWCLGLKLKVEHATMLHSYVLINVLK